MHKILFIFLGLATSLGVYGQTNLAFRSNLNYQQLHNAELNDVWGYVDEVGNEYALVGTTKGTSIVDVTNPDLISEIFWVPGMTSTWRDLKTFGDYAYVTTEAQNGLLIIDMGPLPQSTGLNYVHYFGPSSDPWQSAHNLYVDENGYAYIFGANRDNGGVIILDVHTDPMNPIEVGKIEDYYVHDGFTRNDTLYVGNINDGFFSIYDVSDKANPVYLGGHATPTNFTHNIWPSADGQFVFTTDEKPGAFIGSYDISDMNNIVEVDRIQSQNGSSVIPHNVHVLGNYLVTSYYRDGVLVHDVTDPTNIVEVGRYDTSPNLANNGFNGCWGAYPFLPSMNVLATDIENGLFVLTPTYVQASRVKGNVTEQGSGVNLSGVEVSLSNEPQKDNSNTGGNYGVGTAQVGQSTLSFHKVGYRDTSVVVNLVAGQTLTQDMTLTPIPAYPLTIVVKDQATNQVIPSAFIRANGQYIQHDGQTNGIGEWNTSFYYQENYLITAGKWGYITSCDSVYIDNATNTLEVFLNKGIYDDFSFDFGWTTQASAQTGLWERAIPYGGPGSANPVSDADFDCGKYAYVTGNAETLDADADDVDNGNVILMSPTFDLTGYTDPYLNFRRYFFSFYGPNPPDDSFRVLVLNGTTTVLVEDVPSTPSEFYQWISRSIRLSDKIAITNSMTILVRVSDAPGNPNITEGGFDYFFISEGNSAGVEELDEKAEITLYPNPVNNTLFVEGAELSKGWSMVTLEGKNVGHLCQENSQSIDVSNLPTGVYLLQVNGVVKRFIKA